MNLFVSVSSCNNYNAKHTYVIQRGLREESSRSQQDVTLHLLYLSHVFFTVFKGNCAACVSLTHDIDVLLFFSFLCSWDMLETAVCWKG